MNNRQQLGLALSRVIPDALTMLERGNTVRILLIPMGDELKIQVDEGQMKKGLTQSETLRILKPGDN